MNNSLTKTIYRKKRRRFNKPSLYKLKKELSFVKKNYAPEVKEWEQHNSAVKNTWESCRSVPGITVSTSTDAQPFKSAPYNLAKGTEGNQRVGCEIRIIRVAFKCVIVRHAESTAVMELVRVILWRNRQGVLHGNFYDYGTNAGEILTNKDSDNPDLVKVIDKIVPLTSLLTSYVIDTSFKCNVVSRWDVDDTLLTNNYQVYIGSDKATNVALQHFTIKIWYTDA